MNKDHEDIQRVMESLDNVTPVDPGPYFYSKLRHRLTIAPSSSTGFSWYYAVGMLLLLALNVFTIVSISRTDQLASDTSIELLTQEYQLGQPDLYEFVEEEYTDVSIVNEGTGVVESSEEE